MRCPYPCSHYHSTVHKQTVSLDLGRGGACSSRVVFAPSFGFAQTNGNHLNPCRDRRPRLSVSLFAPSFGFAQTNALSQTSVGEGLAPPVLCPLYLSTVEIKKGGYEIHPYIYGFLFVALPFYAVFLTYTHSLKAVVLSKSIIKTSKNHTFYCF